MTKRTSGRQTATEKPYASPTTIHPAWNARAQTIPVWPTWIAEPLVAKRKKRSTSQLIPLWIALVNIFGNGLLMLIAKYF
jgi:hypothetical protein